MALENYMRLVGWLVGEMGADRGIKGGQDHKGERKWSLIINFYPLYFTSKRTTVYLPAFQVWVSDHPHPQNDVRDHNKCKVCLNKNCTIPPRLWRCYGCR